MPDPVQAGWGRDADQTRIFTSNQRLVVVSPGAAHERMLTLDSPARTIGRAADNDLCLDDPYVSRHHAVVRCAGSAVLVEDAGSAAGVLVNGQPIDGPALLRPGDVIRLGRIDLQFRSEEGSAPRQGPPESASRAARREAASSGGVRFDVGAQRAGVISNVGRDQISYNEYALKFEPLRRRARITIRAGLALVLTGFALSLIGFLRYISVFREWMNLVFSSSDVSPEQAGQVFSRLLTSTLPFMIAAMAMVLAGITCIVTGLLMRRRAREAAR
jgi:pSer/pThr/pTyr-binding forkhead associated (FHA) protein